MSTKFFSIIVGDKPAKVMVGFLDEGGRPKDEQVAYISKAGTAVPNYSNVWGILERDKKDAKTGVYSGELTGGVQFLKWGDPKGEIIEIRYLPNISSLSVEYQKLKKAVLQDKDSEILLSVGVNNYDPIKDKRLIEFLKVHYLNSESESRDPLMPVAFSTYDPDKITKRKTTDIQRRQQAENIVINANYDGPSLEILASLFHDIDPRQQQDILFADLMEQAENYSFFLEVMDLHRKEFEAVIEKALDVQLINCDTPDVIFIIKNGNKEYLIKDISPVGNESAKHHVLNNFFLPEFFEPLNQLKEQLKEFEEFQLQ